MSAQTIKERRERGRFGPPTKRRGYTAVRYWVLAIPRLREVIRPFPKAARCALAEEDFEAP